MFQLLLKCVREDVIMLDFSNGENSEDKGANQLCLQSNWKVNNRYSSINTENSWSS